jgi:hypothetical protein
VAFHRVAAKTRLRRLKNSVTAWDHYWRVVRLGEKATDIFITRRAAATLRKYFEAWNRDACDERHEDAMVGGLLRACTRPTLNLLLLLFRASSA